MTVYCQHVGEKGGQRDFPKTIGTRTAGLKLFSFDEVEPHITSISSQEKSELAGQLAHYTPDGFQIWGIPSGAKTVLTSLAVGDALLLLESIGPGGAFAYGGRVVAIPSRESFELSQYLWGDAVPADRLLEWGTHELLVAKVL